MTKKKDGKGFMTVSAIVVMLFTMPFASTIWVKWSTADKIYEKMEAVPASEVALVLGAASYSPELLSPALEDRMDTAIALYQADKIKKLIVSGGPDEALAMKNNAVKKGIPESDLIVDKNGFNTLASIQNIPKDYQKITIVTQRFHLPRALFYAEHLDFQAIGLAADQREYVKIFEFKKRELIGNSKAFFDVFITDHWNEWARTF